MLLPCTCAAIICGVGGAAALVIGTISYCFFKRWVNAQIRAFNKWKAQRQKQKVWALAVACVCGGGGYVGGSGVGRWGGEGPCCAAHNGK
jgi:hypothetical protein